MSRRILLLLCALFFTLQAEETLEQLLDIYKKESDLSNITKKESAGFLDIYTRDDLEKMQAHNLHDVLKTLSSLYLTRSNINLVQLTKPTQLRMPMSTVRLYINDHDMSSTSFGSAFLVWGEMPIEYIDHIEVYKATSSVEFGNENATLIFRLYTKSASRDEGGKVRLLFDNYGSSDLNAYYAEVIDRDVSYFVYAQHDNINRKVYHTTYNSKVYDYESDKDGFNLYANLKYKEWLFEAGNYNKRNDTFIGLSSSLNKTPSGGEIDSRHTYVHITKKFDSNMKLQLAYDDIVYDGTYIDENGIYITTESLPEVVDYAKLRCHDKIFSSILEKKFFMENNSLLLGGFYKNKYFKHEGTYSSATYFNTTNYSNYLNLYSVYMEDSYDLDYDTRLIFSLKGDFFRYQKKVADQDEYILRVGALRNIERFQLKLFYTDTYVPLAFQELYNEENTPYATNPDLKYPSVRIVSASVRYKDEHFRSEFIIATNRLSDGVVYDPTYVYGYKNISETVRFYRYEWKNLYTFNVNNRLHCDVFTSRNSQEMEYSPKYGVNVRSFNAFGKFDLYNELEYRSSYTSLYGNYVGASFDYTAAVKYHAGKDLMIGLRAENIFNDAYKVDYAGAYPIAVTDQKFWINLEYLF